MTKPLGGAAAPPDFQLFGRPFQLDALDSLNLRNGLSFARLELELVARHVKPGDLCIDVGANIGVFTIALARAAGPGGCVQAFEPDPVNFGLLERNVGAWRDTCDIRLHAAACGTQPGTAQLHRSTENMGMHRLYDSACCNGDAVDVPIVRVDDVVTDPVAFVKVDVEGYESQVLGGMGRTLDRSPRVVVLSEFSPLSLMEAGSAPGAYLGQLAERGFAPHRLTEQGLLPLALQALLQECAKLESGDFATLQARCRGRTGDEVLAQASGYVAERGYAGPVIENLVFLRRDQA